MSKSLELENKPLGKSFMYAKKNNGPQQRRCYGSFGAFTKFPL